MGFIKKLIIGLILVVMLFSGYFIYNLFQDKVEAAFLTIESGSAQVDRGDGWENAINNMGLKLNDKVKTIDGVSVITFYESIIVELEADTEVVVSSLAKNKISIKQEKGSTWNKFTSIFGIENYEVETPTTVATVRGTEFGVYYKETEDVVLTSEGKVDVRSLGNNILTEGFGKALRNENGLNSAEVTAGDKKIMLDKAKKTLERLKKLREITIEDNKDLIEKAIKLYGVSEGELKDYLEKIDSGEMDDAQLIEKSPVKLPVMNKFKKFNDEIKKQQELIKSLEIA